MKFDHIGVVVENLEMGRRHLGSLFGIVRWTSEFADPINLVHVQFGLDPAGVCYESISPLGPGSPVLEALRTGNRILNHVAYLVPDIAATAARLAAAQCIPTGSARPAVAYGGRKVQFFVSRLRMMIEIIEGIDHFHVYCSPESAQSKNAL